MAMLIDLFDSRIIELRKNCGSLRFHNIQMLRQDVHARQTSTELYQATGKTGVVSLLSSLNSAVK